MYSADNPSSYAFVVLDIGRIMSVEVIGILLIVICIRLRMFVDRTCCWLCIMLVGIYRYFDAVRLQMYITWQVLDELFRLFVVNHCV